MEAETFSHRIVSVSINDNQYWRQDYDHSCMHHAGEVVRFASMFQNALDGSASTRTTWRLGCCRRHDDVEIQCPQSPSIFFLHSTLVEVRLVDKKWTTAHPISKYSIPQHIDYQNTISEQFVVHLQRDVQRV